MKNEIFLDISSKVEEITGVKISGRTEAATDAKYILITALSELGYSNAEIAAAMGLTRQGVGYLKNCFRTRWELKRNCKEVIKYLESNYLSSK